QIEGWLHEIGAGGAAVDLSSQRTEMQTRGESTESIDWSDRVRAALRPARLDQA
ncbi:MAG: hypothetical protein QOJ08_450, partial [Ilumatobacteraceae bacterium]